MKQKEQLQIEEQLFAIENCKRKIEQLDHDIKMVSIDRKIAEEAIINSLAEQSEIEYEPHSINWYRVICKRALTYAEELRDKAYVRSETSGLLRYAPNGEDLVRQAQKVEALVADWEKRYCDYNLTIDPYDKRMGNVGAKEKIERLFTELGNADIRKLAEELATEHWDLGAAISLFTPDLPTFAVAAYLIRNNWTKKKDPNGEWEEDHTPTDAEEIMAEIDSTVN